MFIVVLEEGMQNFRAISEEILKILSFKEVGGDLVFDVLECASKFEVTFRSS